MLLQDIHRLRIGYYFFLSGLVAFAVILAPPPATAATLQVGETISVPLTLSASAPVVIIDVSVTVQGGSLESLQCGGSGFSVTTSGSTNCTMLHVGSGTTGGTVGTATVKATTPGTLAVSAGSSLKGVLNTPVTGQVSGATHVVIGSEATDPTATATPAASATPINASPQATQSPSSSTTNTPSQTSQSNQSVGTGDQSSQSNQTSTSGSGSFSSNTTVVGDEFIITQELATPGIVTIPATAARIRVAPDALITTQTPLFITLPSRAAVESTWDLSAYIDEASASPRIVLPRPLQIEKATADVQASVVFPANTDIRPSTSRCAAPTFDGTLAPVRITANPNIAIPGGIAEVSVDVGRNDCEIDFGQPLELDFPNKAGRSAAFRSFDQSTFTTIDDSCALVNGIPQLPNESGTCTFDRNDGALVILSSHATTFMVYSTSTKIIFWVIVGLVGVGAIVGGVTLYLRSARRRNQAELQPQSYDDIPPESQS